MCTAAVVTVALFSVLQLVCSYLFVCMSVSLCPNLHGLPVPESNSTLVEKPVCI